MDNEFILQDRIQKIRQIINQYGEDNFYISFSGGKDSTVLSHLVDMAFPNNKIPRVYADTGIDFNMVHDFVIDMTKNDNRFVIIKPSIPIIPMLKKYGYPFKSKHHSNAVCRFQEHGITKWVNFYLQEGYNWSANRCPKKLKYQFDESWDSLKISDKCCVKLKEEPLKKWQEENKRPFAIIGLMIDEGGRRQSAKCLAWKSKNKFNFQPLVAVTKEWEDWYIEQYDIKICDIYYPPYNFERTGCKGCPFNIHIQKELDTLEKYFPAERKQCEIIWKPVYDEYRRIHYRLKEVYKNGV